ncbi:MAG: NADH-ubiquinone oxidoreductase-F iron-sulfur binding region domain-containing protein [Mycobacteriaceae bacterium]
MTSTPTTGPAARHRPPHDAGPAGDQRLFAPAGPALTQHLARYGPTPTLTRSDELIGLVDQAGLTGRGGAGFPTGRKLAAITGRRPVVIANGAEGEPASHKDQVLLQHAPHLVLDGLAAVAAALGSRQTHLYAGASALPAVRHALQERRAAGGDGATPHLHEAPDTFIAGEETAVINSVAGRRAVPSDRTVRITDSGLRGRPTLVHNVETLAHIALIARYGPRWFRSVGTPTEPGTMLVTLSGEAPAGVLEVPLGTPLEDLLRDHAGLEVPKVRAVLLGGYHGTWVSSDRTARACLSRESLAPLGATPGAGVVHVLGAGWCGLQVSADIATYLAQQSAGQCGPCLNGLPALAETLSQLADRRPQPNTVRQVTRLLALVDGRGSCKHPDGTARFIRSALRTFSRDVELHLGGRCEADGPLPRPAPRQG